MGQLYYFVAEQGVRTVAQFNGTGSTLAGAWKKIEVLDRAKAGKQGYDALGYKAGLTLRREAKAGGAFQFPRPEDVSTHPSIGTRAVLASTGWDTVFPGHDAWGALYQIDVDLERMTARLTIVYDGDDAGGAGLAHPDAGIRNPDNLDWADDGWIYIQEDNAKQRDPLFGSHSGQEASLWRLDPLTGEAHGLPGSIDPSCCPRAAPMNAQGRLEHGSRPGFSTSRISSGPALGNGCCWPRSRLTRSATA